MADEPNPANEPVPKVPRREAPITEPVIVPCVYVTGTIVDNDNGIVRITGWELTPDCEEGMLERRIVVRFVMPLAVARKMCEGVSGGYLQ